MNIKKLLAVALAFAMLLSVPMTASAASPIDWDSVIDSIDWDPIYAEYPDFNWDDYGLRYDMSTGYVDLIKRENGKFEVLKADVYNYGPISWPEEKADAKEYDREAEAYALAIKATGIPQEAWQGAEEEGKSIGEYLNNLVITVPGLDEAVPVGQGGGVIIDGETTGATISIQKPLLAHVDSAKSMASTIGGKVLNVVSVKTSAVFGTATVNFYMPGVTADQNIQVYQYDAGQWTSVNVSEVREDHVVADLTSLGIIAFVEVQ